MNLHNVVWFGDPGIDDTIAVIYAILSKEVNFLASCGSSGNTSARQSSLNFSFIFEEMGLDYSVFRGLPRKRRLVRLLKEVHGEDGIGGTYERKSLRKISSVMKMPEFLSGARSFVLVNTGPFSDLAMLCEKFPSLFKSKVERIVAMGGSRCGGNVTPSAEFNIYSDPISAQRIINSGIPVILVPLDITSRVTLTTEDFAWLQDKRFPFAGKLFKMITYYQKFHESYEGFSGFTAHDPVALLALLKPELFRFTDVPVQVEKKRGITFGHTAMDFRYRSRNSTHNQISVATDIDVERARDVLINTIRRGFDLLD